MAMPGSSKILLLAVMLMAFPLLAQKRKDHLINKIEPILEKHCFPCHHDTKRSADISLRNIFMGINDTRALIVRDGKVWMNVVKQLQSGAMPPRGEPRLTQQEHDTLVNTINE